METVSAKSIEFLFQIVDRPGERRDSADLLSHAPGIVEDEEVLEAIEGHVYGVSPDHKIGMALYVADVSEPGRGVNRDIRELALAGRLEEAYQEVARRLGILPEAGPRDLKGPEAVQ